MREICYIIQAVGTCAMATTAIAIDLLLCGMCLYIMAMYKELQRQLGRIDQKPNIMLIKSNHLNDQQQSLIDCIEFHLGIIR